MTKPTTAEVGDGSKQEQSINFTPRPSIARSTFLTFQPRSVVVRCNRRERMATPYDSDDRGSPPREQGT
jgi:hypothetical protein